MQNFSMSPQEMLASLWRNYRLIFSLVRRDVIGRYRGSVMGILWSFFNPVLMLTVYTFVFSVVFNAKWSGGGGSKVEFALILFAGIIIFNIFSECVTRAPGLIIANANYVKKVVFPLEVLPWVVVGAAMFHALISFGVWLVAYLIFFGLPHPTIMFLPFVLAPLILLTMGISWLLASLGVYLRDIAQFIGVLTTMLLFLSPIFYPANALPESYRNLLFLNPLTPAIEQARNYMFWGVAPEWWVVLGYMGGSLAIAWLGFAWFQKTRKGFADVL